LKSKNTKKQIKLDKKKKLDTKFQTGN
jgi:hypothetical protein